uniref:Uncharacterized protein n=1 Tax=Anguilla anguilla TaxID=7936 RepID=A0A0E9VBB4_ANGAN
MKGGGADHREPETLSFFPFLPFYLHVAGGLHGLHLV